MIAEPLYFAPHDLAEAQHLLATQSGATLVAGGQWLVPRLRTGAAEPASLISTHRLTELRGIDVEPDRLTVGASETHDSVRSSALAPGWEVIPQLCASIGDPAVRHRGTIGGALVSDPQGTDWSAALLGLDGRVRTNVGDIDAEGFLAATLQPLGTGTIVTSVSFRKPLWAAYRKLPHAASGAADPGLFVAEMPEGWRVVLLGADGPPFRWTAAEHWLAEGGTDVGTANMSTTLPTSSFMAARAQALLRALIDSKKT